MWWSQDLNGKFHKFLSSSVKKLIVLGAVANVPENYFNVKVILDELNELFLGLGYYSEQAFESMHSDIKVR